MSSIVLSPNASGTGIFTVAAPNSNTNRTLTLPDNTGTILTSATTTGFPTGSVIQVVQKQNIGSSNTYTVTTSSSYADMLNMAATITPTASSSKILIISVGSGLVKGTATDIGLKLLANSSAVWTQERFGYMTTGTPWVPINWATTTLHSPATTSAVTYKFQFAVSGGTGPEARIGDYSSTAADTYTAVILMEIAG